MHRQHSSSARRHRYSVIAFFALLGWLLVVSAMASHAHRVRLTVSTKYAVRCIFNLDSRDLRILDSANGLSMIREASKTADSPSDIAMLRPNEDGEVTK